MSIEEIKSALATKHAEIEAKLDAVNKASEKKGAEYDLTISELDKAIKELNSQILDLAQKHGATHEQMEAKTFGQSFVESAEFKNYMAGNSTKARAEIKNTIVNSGNTVSRHEQLPGLVPGAFRNLTVMPTVQQGMASSNVLYYSRELAYTNATAATAEGGVKPESSLTFEEITKTVVTLATIIKVSKQALADSTFLQSYIDRRLRHGVNQTVENYVVNNATDGWLASGNHTVVSPLLTTDVYGLAAKMKYAVIAADYEADYFYMNPADWEKAETSRRSTSDGAFIAASGAVTYVNNGLTPLLWGLPVVLSNNVPAGRIICKSMDADMYFNRESVMVEMFEQDGDNVQRNLVTVRAETRGVAAVMTPAAIVTGLISGITAPA